MTTPAANTSIAESMPKPTSAIEPAAEPGGDRDEPLEGIPRDDEPREAQAAHAKALSFVSLRGRQTSGTV